MNREREDEDLLQEAQDAATEEPLDMREFANGLLGRYRPDPARFDRWPSDEQMEMFKRGTR